MKITFYGFNAFLIDSSNTRIAIDPGALFFYRFRFSSLTPNYEWPSISRIVITHGDAEKAGWRRLIPVYCKKL